MADEKQSDAVDEKQGEPTKPGPVYTASDRFNPDKIFVALGNFGWFQFKHVACVGYGLFFPVAAILLYTFVGATPAYRFSTSVLRFKGLISKLFIFYRDEGVTLTNATMKMQLTYQVGWMLVPLPTLRIRCLLKVGSAVIATSALYRTAPYRNASLMG